MLVSDRESVPHDIAALTASIDGNDSDSDRASSNAGGRAQWRRYGQYPAAPLSAQRDWTLIWHGQRRVSRGERLFLYAREGLAMK